MSPRWNPHPDVRTGRHVAHNLHVHLVFVTKFRRKAFTDDMLTRCEEVMREVCQDFEAELKQFNGEEDHVHLLVHYPPKVQLSRLVTLLLQLTTNLVHNTIVHNLPEQGTVWVNTSVRHRTVVLAVENTGAPLTPQLAATLTEPFQRGTERLRGDHAGVGLGLAIVKTITQAHDGTLTLTPRAAGGMRVTVELPAPSSHTGR